MNEAPVRAVLRLVAVVVVTLGLCLATSAFVLALQWPGENLPKRYATYLPDPGASPGSRLLDAAVSAAAGGLLFAGSRRLATRLVGGAAASATRSRAPR